MAITTYPGSQRLAGRIRPQAAVSVSRYDLTSLRRRLQVALAAVWLLDAALQYQPYMFTKGFVTGTLAPAAQGNPALIATPMTWVFHLVATHAAIFNTAFASIQLLIAAGLFWRRSVKLALAASIAWAVGLWWIGEGFGGVLSGASPAMGAPGAAILYALIALAVWPRADRIDRRPPRVDSVADGGPLGHRGAKLMWATLWGALAYLFLLPANRAPGALHDAVAGMAAGEPGWLAGLERHLGYTLAGHGTAASIILAMACDLIAVAIFIPRLARAGVVGAAVLGTLIWVTEAFGGIFTGQGTDPNTGLLLVLVAATFWPGIRSSSAAPDLDPGRQATVKRPNRQLGLLAACALLATGCAAAQATSKTDPSSMTIATAGPGMSMPGMSMPGMSMPGMSMPVPAPLPAARPSTEVGPSESARMVCSSEIRGDVATALALSAQPTVTSTWANHLYTCTYHLAGGPLVLAVKELNDIPSARAYFTQLGGRLAATQRIQGLASLGLPGYQSSQGTVIFLKDDKTLQVDASALPGQVGPHHVARTEFAYQIATNILGCWSGK